MSNALISATTRTAGKLAMLAGVCALALAPQNGRAIDSNCSVMKTCTAVDMSSFTSLNPLNSLNGMTGLTAGGLGSMDLGQMLQQTLSQVITQVTSQLLQQVMGNLGGQNLGSALGGISGMSNITSSFGNMGSSGFGLTNTGLTTNLGSLSSGGIQGAIVNAAANIGASMLTQAITGGISGGSSNSNSIGGYSVASNSSTASTVGSLASPNAALDETSINYKAGYLDAQNGLGFDERFVGDPNYAAGFAAAQGQAAAGTTTI